MPKSRVKDSLVALLLLAAVVIVALNAIFAFRAVNFLLESESSVQHTWQVIYQVERIMASAADAESGGRGFLLTGQESYLEPYLSAMQDLPREFDDFTSLTRDNPPQQARIREIRSILDQRLLLMAHRIEQRRRNDPQALVPNGTGKVQMDRLRRVADDLDGEEHRLLALRTAEARRASRNARLTIGIASSLDFFLLILMFRYFARERTLRLASEETADRLRIARAEAEANAAEVQMLNTTLEERVRLRTAELENTNRELEAFSYSVSHDLRSPLRTIDGFSLALEEDYAGAVDDVGRDYIRRVRSGVQRMGQLIDALLQLSRITRAELTREPVDLSHLASTVAATLAEENTGTPVRFRIEAGLHAEADAKLVQVAMENLLGNAVKFSSKVVEPVVEFGWDSTHSAWFVRDNGAGFDMQYAAKLFNAFNRLHGDKDFKGSGIGLATVARVIRRHHGQISAESHVGHGATFWFTLG